MDISLEDKKKIAESHINYLREMAEKRSKIMQGNKPVLFDEKFLNTDADKYSAEANLRAANTSMTDEELAFFRRRYSEGITALRKGNYNAAVDALGDLPEEAFKEFVNEDTFYDLNKNRFEAEAQEARKAFTGTEHFDQISNEEKGNIFKVNKNDAGGIWSGFGTDEGVFNVLRAVGNYLNSATIIDNDDSLVQKGFKAALGGLANSTVNLVGGAWETVINETGKILENPAQTLVQTGGLAVTPTVEGFTRGFKKLAEWTGVDNAVAQNIDQLTKWYEEGYDSTFGIAEDIDTSLSLLRGNELNAQRIKLAQEAKEEIASLKLTPRDNAIIAKYEWEVANGFNVHSKEVSEWLSKPENVERLKKLEDFRGKAAQLRQINETLDPTFLQHIPTQLYIDDVKSKNMENELKRGDWGWGSYHAVALTLDYYKSLFTVDPLNDIPSVLGQASYSIGLMAPYLVPGFGEAAFAQRAARLGMRFGSGNRFAEFLSRHTDNLGSLLRNHQQAYYIAKNIASQTHQNYWENLAEGNPEGLVWTDNALGALAGGWAAAVDIAGDTLALYGAKVFGGALGRAFRDTGASVFRQAIRDALATGSDYAETLLGALRRSSIGAALGESQIRRLLQDLAVHGVVDGTGEAIAGAVEQVLNDLAAHGVVTDQVTVNALMSAVAATGMKGSFGIHSLTMPSFRNQLSGVNRLGNDYLNEYRRLTGSTSFEDFNNNSSNPSERGTDAQRAETERLQNLIENEYNTNETENGRVTAIVNALAEDLGNRGIAAPVNLAQLVRQYVRGRNRAGNDARRLQGLNALLHRQLFGHHYSDNGIQIRGREATPLAEADRERINQEWRNAAYGSDFLNREGASRAQSDIDIVNSYANQRLELGQIAENIQAELDSTALPTYEREAAQRRLDDVLAEIAELDAQYGNQAHNNAVRHFMERNAGHLNEVELTGNTNYSSRDSGTPATEESRRDTRDFEEAHDLRGTNRFSEEYLNRLAEDLRSTDDAVRDRAQRIRSRLRQEINNKFNAAIQEREGILHDPHQLENEGNFISNNIRRLLGNTSAITGELNARGRDILRREIAEYQRRLQRFNELLDTLDDIDFETRPDPDGGPTDGGPGDRTRLDDDDDIDDGVPPPPRDTPEEASGGTSDAAVENEEAPAGGDGDDGSDSIGENETGAPSGNPTTNPINTGDTGNREEITDDGSTPSPTPIADPNVQTDDAGNPIPSADEETSASQLNTGEPEEAANPTPRRVNPHAQRVEDLSQLVEEILSRHGVTLPQGNRRRLNFLLQLPFTNPALFANAEIEPIVKQYVQALVDYYQVPGWTHFITDADTVPDENFTWEVYQPQATARVNNVESDDAYKEWVNNNPDTVNQWNKELVSSIEHFLLSYSIFTGYQVPNSINFWHKTLWTWCAEFPLLYQYILHNTTIDKKYLDYFMSTQVPLGGEGTVMSRDSVNSAGHYMIHSLSETIFDPKVEALLNKNDIAPAYHYPENNSQEVNEAILYDGIASHTDSLLTVVNTLYDALKFVDIDDYNKLSLTEFMEYCATEHLIDNFRRHVRESLFFGSSVSYEDVFAPRVNTTTTPPPETEEQAAQNQAEELTESIHEAEQQEVENLETAEIIPAERIAQEPPESEEEEGTLDIDVPEEATDEPVEEIDQGIDTSGINFNSPAARNAVMGNPAANPAPAPVVRRPVDKSYLVRKDLLKFLTNIGSNPSNINDYKALLRGALTQLLSSWNSYVSRAVDSRAAVDAYYHLVKLLIAKDEKALDKAIEIEYNATGNKAFRDTLLANKGNLLLFLQNDNTKNALGSLFQQAENIRQAIRILSELEIEAAFPGRNILEISDQELVNNSGGKFVQKDGVIYIKIGSGEKHWNNIKEHYFKNVIPGEEAFVPCVVRNAVPVARETCTPANTNTKGTTRTKTTVNTNTGENIVSVWLKNQATKPVALSQEFINNRLKSVSQELKDKINAVKDIVSKYSEDIDLFEKGARVGNANITQYTIDSTQPIPQNASKTYSENGLTGVVSFKHPDVVYDENNSFIITNAAPEAVDENTRFDLFEFATLKNNLKAEQNSNGTWNFGPWWWKDKKTGRVIGLSNTNSFAKNLINFYGALVLNSYIPVSIIDASNFTIETKNKEGRVVSTTQPRRVVWVKADQETARNFWLDGATKGPVLAISNLYRALHPKQAGETTEIRQFQGTTEPKVETPATPAPVVSPSALNPSEVLAQAQNGVINPSAAANTSVPVSGVVSNQVVAESMQPETPEPVTDVPAASGGDGASTDTPARTVTGDAPLLRGKPYTSTQISANNSLYRLIHHLGIKDENREKIQEFLENAIYKEKKSLETAISEYVTSINATPIEAPVFNRVLTKIFAPLKDNFRLDKKGNLTFSEEAKNANNLTIKNNILYLNEFFTLTSELRDSTYLSSYGSFCSTIDNIAKESGATNLTQEGVDPQLKGILKLVAKAIRANLQTDFNGKMDEIAFNAMEFFTQNYLFMTPRTGVIAWNSPIVASLCHSTDDTARQEELEYIKQNNEIGDIRRLSAAFATFNSFSHRTGELVFDCLGIRNYSQLKQVIPSLTDTQLDAVKEMLGMVCTKAFIDSGFVINEIINLNTKSDPDSQKNILRGRASNELTYTKKDKETYFTAKEKSLDPFRDLHNGILTLSISDITGHAYQDNNVKLHPEDVNTHNETPVRNPKNREMLEKNAKLPFVIDKYYTDFIEEFLSQKVENNTLQEYIIKGLNGEIALDFNSHTSPFFRKNSTISKFTEVIGLESTNGKDAVTANAININNQNKLKTMVNIISLKYRFQLENKDAKYDNGNTYYWTTYSVGANSRFMYRGTDINPQADKEFTRQITYRDGDAVEVGFDQNFIVGDYQISEHDIFAFGVMQNLGLKPEKKGNLQTWYKDKNMMKAVRILVKYAKESKAATTYNKKLSVWLKCREELEHEKFEFEHKFAIINIMQTMEQFASAEIPENCTVDEFWKALDSSLKDGKYTNYMHVESDGVTNGPAMGVLFTLGILSFIKKQGLNTPEVDGYNFLDSIGVARLQGGLENVTMYDTKEAKENGKHIFNNKDLYETIKANIDLDILCDVGDTASDFTLDSKIRGTECTIKRFLEVLFDANPEKMQKDFDALNNTLSEQKKKLSSGVPDTAQAARKVINTAYAEFIGNYISRNWIKGPATQGAYGAMLKAITRGLIDHPIGGIFTTFFNKINTQEYMESSTKTKKELDKLLSVLANPNITEISKYNQDVAEGNRLVNNSQYVLENNPTAFSISSKFEEIRNNYESNYFSQANPVVPKWEFWGNLKAHVRNYALPYNLSDLMQSLGNPNLPEEVRPRTIEAFVNKLYASFLMEAQFSKYKKKSPYWFTWVENQYKEYQDNEQGINSFSEYLQSKLKSLFSLETRDMAVYNEYVESLNDPSLQRVTSLAELAEVAEKHPDVATKIQEKFADQIQKLGKSLDELYAVHETENFYPYIMTAINYVAAGKYSTSWDAMRVGFPTDKQTYSLSKDAEFQNKLDYIFGTGFTADLFAEDTSYSKGLLVQRISMDGRDITPVAASHITSCKFFDGESANLLKSPDAFLTLNFKNTYWDKVVGKNKLMKVTPLLAKQYEIANYLMSYFNYDSTKKDNGIETLINTAEAYNRIDPYFYRRNFKSQVLHRRGIPPEASPVIVSEEPYDTAEARERESRRFYIFDCSQEVLGRFQPSQNKDGTYYKPADMITGKTGGNYVKANGETEYVQCSEAYYMADTVYSPGKDSEGNPVVKYVDLVTVPNALGDNGLVVKEAKTAGIPVLNYSAYVIKYNNKYYLSSTKEGRQIMLKVLASKEAERNKKELKDDYNTAELYPLSLLKEIFKDPKDGPRIGHRLKLIYVKNPSKFAEIYANFLGGPKTAQNAKGSFSLTISNSKRSYPKASNFIMGNCDRSLIDNVEIKDIFTKSSKYTERAAENYEKGYDHSRGFTSDNIYDLTHAVIPLFENTIGKAIFKSMMKPMGNNRAMTQMCIAPLEILSFMADAYKNILNGKTPLYYSIGKIKNREGVEEDYLANFSNINYQEIFERNASENPIAQLNAAPTETQTLLEIKEALVESFNTLFAKGALKLPSGEGIAILKKEYESDLINQVRMTDTNGVTVVGSGRIPSTNSAGISLTVDGIQSNDSNIASDTALEGLRQTGTMPLNIHDAVEMLCNNLAFMFNRLQNKAFLNSTANPNAKSKYLQYASFFKNYANLFAKYSKLLSIDLQKEIVPVDGKYTRDNVFSVAVSMGLASDKTLNDLGLELGKDENGNTVYKFKEEADPGKVAEWEANAGKLVNRLVCTQIAIRQAFTDGIYNAFLESVRGMILRQENHKKNYSYHMGLFNKAVTTAMYATIGHYIDTHEFSDYQNVLTLEDDWQEIVLPDGRKQYQTGAVTAEMQQKFIEFFTKAYNPYASIDEDAYNGVLADPITRQLYEKGKEAIDQYKVNLKSSKEGREAYKNGFTLFNVDQRNNVFNTIFTNINVQYFLFNHMLQMVEGAEAEHLDAIKEFNSGDFSIFQYNMGIAFKGKELMDTYATPIYRASSRAAIKKLYGNANATPYNEVKSTIATVLESNDPMLRDQFPMDKTPDGFWQKKVSDTDIPVNFERLSTADKERVLKELAMRLPRYVDKMKQIDFNETYSSSNPWDFIADVQNYISGEKLFSPEKGSMIIYDPTPNAEGKHKAIYSIPLVSVMALMDNYGGKIQEYCPDEDHKDAFEYFNDFSRTIKTAYREKFDEWKNVLPQELRTAGKDERHNTAGSRTDADIRSALNAAINGQPINDPTVQQIVTNTRNQVLNTYDAMEDTVTVTTASGTGTIRAISAQFSNTLRQRMERVADMLAGVRVMVVNHGRAGLAATAQRAVAITRNVGDAIQHGIPMSVREMYAHENMHIVFQAVDRYSPEYKTLRKSWAQAREYFANNMHLLRQHNWTAAELGSQDLADQANAREDANAQVMYDYMFGTGAEGTASNDVIEEFAVLAYTNEFINNALSQVPYVKEAINNTNDNSANRGYLGTLIDAITTAITILFRRVSNKFRQNNINVTTSLMDTVEAVFEAAEQTQQRYNQNQTRQVIDRLSTAFDDTFDEGDTQAAQSIDDLGRTPVMQRAQQLGQRLTTTIKQLNRFTREMVNEVTNSYFENNGRRVIAAFINKISALNRTRQQNATEDTRVLLGSFANQLTAPMARAIRNAVCILDLQCLKNVGYNNQEIMNMLTTGTGLDTAIQHYNNAIVNSPVLNIPELPNTFTNYVINAANNLACKLATDSWSNELTLHNASQILLGFGTNHNGLIINHSSTEEQIRVEAILNAYISLQAMKLYREHEANQEDLRLIQELYRVENNAAAIRATNKTTGFDAVLNYHQGSVEAARRYLGDTTITRENDEYTDNYLVRATNVRKGYLKPQFNPYYESVIVTDEYTYNDLRHKGYEEYHGPEVSAFTPNMVGFTPRLMYNTAPIVNRHTSGAMATIDTHFVGAEFVSGREALETYLSTSQDTFSTILPITPNQTIAREIGFDSRGIAKALRFVDSMHLREQLLKEDTNFAAALASTAASIEEKQVSFAANRHLVDVLVELHNRREDQNYDPEEWIELSPESDNEIVQEDYSTIPQDTRRYIHEQLHGEHLFIRKDYYNLIFGFHNASLRRLMDPTTQEHATLNDRFRRLIEAVGYRIFARRWGLRAQAIWEYLVHTAKDTVVNKSFVVSLKNIWSNIQVLSIAGVNPVRAIADTIRGYEYFTDYNDKMRRMRNALTRLNIEELTADERARLRSEYTSLQNDIQNNPMSEFIHLGGATSIIGGEYDINREDASPLPEALQFLGDNVRNDAGRFRRLTPLLDILFVRHNTKWYDMAQELATGTDTVAKWIYYTHLREQQYPHSRDRVINEQNATNAFLDAQEMFINYDLPTNKYMQAANDLGVIWFSKYILRTQVPIFHLFNRRFARAISYTLFWQLFNPPMIDGAILSSNLFNIEKNLYNFKKNPITAVLESSGQLPAFRAFSWFSDLMGSD